MEDGEGRPIPLPSQEGSVAEAPRTMAAHKEPAHGKGPATRTSVFVSLEAAFCRVSQRGYVRLEASVPQRAEEGAHSLPVSCHLPSCS